MYRCLNGVATTSIEITNKAKINNFVAWKCGNIVAAMLSRAQLCLFYFALIQILLLLLFCYADKKLHIKFKL